MDSELGLSKSEYVANNFERLDGQLGDLPENIQTLIRALPKQEQDSLLGFSPDSQFSTKRANSRAMRKGSVEELQKWLDEGRVERGLYNEEEVSAMSEKDRATSYVWTLWELGRVLDSAKIVDIKAEKVEKLLESLDVMWANRGKRGDAIILPSQGLFDKSRADLEGVRNRMAKIALQLKRSVNLPGKRGEATREDLRKELSKYGYKDDGTRRLGQGVWREAEEIEVETNEKLLDRARMVRKYYETLTYFLEYFDALEFASYNLDYIRQVLPNYGPHREKFKKLYDKANLVISDWAGRHAEDQPLKTSGSIIGGVQNPERRKIILDNAMALIRSALVIREDPDRQSSLLPTLNQLKVALRLLVGK